MKVRQGTDNATAWRRSFAMYVPPDFDVFDFDDDAGASGVVRDLCSWRGHPGYPADGVALSWTCGSRKVLVATGLLEEARSDTPREDVLWLAWSQSLLLALDKAVTGEVGVAVQRVAADDRVWGPWVVPVDSGSLRRCEYARVGDVMVGYGYRDDRVVLIAATGGSGPHWALCTLTGERALGYVTDPYAPTPGL